MSSQTYDRRFYQLFLICLILVSVPIKNFAYVVPPLYLALQLFGRDNGTAWRAVLLTAGVTVISAFSLMWDSAQGQTVNAPGMVMALLTFFPVILFVCERFDKPVDDVLLRKLIDATAWFVIFQSSVAMLQFLISRNPDTVAGTFGLFDFRRSGVTISQVYFTFTIFGATLFLMLAHERRLVRVAIACGLLACALAQSGHQTVFFVASLGGCSILYWRRLRTAVATLALLAILLVAVFQLYPRTFTHAQDWFDKTFQSRKSPKRLVVEQTPDVIGQPKNLIVGTGMGQFTSRAALITSNDFLRVKLPTLLVGRSEYFTKIVQPGRRLFDRYGEGSAISKPYFSLLSIVVEFGVPLALLLAVVIAFHLRRSLRLMGLMGATDRLNARIGWLSIAGLLFFLLCCTVENYAEFPQAIFVPWMLYVAAGSRANWSTPDSDSDSAPDPDSDSATADPQPANEARV